MKGKGNPPRYAVRLVILIVFAGVIFFGGLQLFVPEGSKLTGSYDAASLKYIAAAPVSYQGSASCGAANCHETLFKTWSAGAHGAKQEQSKCEVCHGPQGTHPAKGNTLQKVRGDGDIVELCLTCHRKMKARSTTGQPQISPQLHPYPHDGVLTCTQCHNPHSPALGKSTKSAAVTEGDVVNVEKEKAPKEADNGPPIAASCFTCHGPSGRGGFAPVLAGQSYEALKDKLYKYKSGVLKNPMMSPVASPLKDEEVEALAHYFAGVS